LEETNLQLLILLVRIFILIILSTYLPILRLEKYHMLAWKQLWPNKNAHKWKKHNLKIVDSEHSRGSYRFRLLRVMMLTIWAVTTTGYLAIHEGWGNVHYLNILIIISIIIIAVILILELWCWFSIGLQRLLHGLNSWKIIDCCNFGFFPTALLLQIAVPDA
jgi:hypothetical protein